MHSKNLSWLTRQLAQSHSKLHASTSSTLNSMGTSHLFFLIFSRTEGISSINCPMWQLSPSRVPAYSTELLKHHWLPQLQGSTLNIVNSGLACQLSITIKNIWNKSLDKKEMFGFLSSNICSWSLGPFALVCDKIVHYHGSKCRDRFFTSLWWFEYAWPMGSGIIRGGVALLKEGGHCVGGFEDSNST